jgi:polar amino acid transport system permease protein
MSGGALVALGAYVVPIVNGVVMTLLLIGLTALFGGALSVAGAVGRRSGTKWVRAVAGWYVEVFRNTPFIVQLFFIYFGLPSLGLRLSPFTAAVLAMTLNLAAYGAEMVRAGLDAVSRGQWDAARALGLHNLVVFRLVALPQALRAVFPALVSQVVITMLESAVVSQIALRDLTYEADLIQSRTFRAFETYALATAIYLGLSIVVRRVLDQLGLRLLGHGVG